ncbi:MAG: glycosyltransferase family 2 protein, partial [Sedimentisphaerales bacterium]|nr:glycosyltransferase family 2 protein [Sedimentisphaerales bacterium]
MVEDNRPTLSVVVPVLDEQDSLRPLYNQITHTLAGRYDYEIVFVDDGSTDRSFEILRDIQASDLRVCVIRFSRNFGQTAALSAGFAYARGQIVVALDADLQNDPSDIPLLIDKLQE